MNSNLCERNANQFLLQFKGQPLKYTIKFRVEKSILVLWGNNLNICVLGTMIFHLTHDCIYNDLHVPDVKKTNNFDNLICLLDGIV